MPIPTGLNRGLSPWASVYYYEYSFGFSLIQKFIARKFSIHIWRIHADGPGLLYPASDRPTIAIQAMLRGNLDCLLTGFGEKILQEDRYELFYVPVSINEARVKEGDYESFHIELEPGFLEDIAETYPSAKDLLTRFNDASENGKPMFSANISYVARSIIKNIRTCDKTGGDLLIQLHRYVVDLLGEYITSIKEMENDEEKKGLPHKEKLIRIKYEILANPNVANQELKKIAKKFGLSITELKKEFKSHFNEPPGAFIRFHALNKAYYLITMTSQSIDDIADEVGYGYRSNFDKAFKNQFGYLPASLRQTNRPG